MINTRAHSEPDDESSEDGCVESLHDDDSDAIEEKLLGGGNEATVNATTTNKYLPRESIICCHYDPPVLTFDGSDWTAITGPRGQHFAIGVDSFDKNTEFYTKSNSPAGVFSALTFMMSASLEHNSVTDKNSTLIDKLLVQIKRSSFPKDERTPDFIHTNLCLFTSIIGVNTLRLLVLLRTMW
jgi:hypothetical protein